MPAKIAESGQGALSYVAPRWLPGGQLQTIWPALYSRRVLGPALPYRRERWTTPDADFVDVDYLDDGIPPGMQRPLLVVFHGLEGSSRSHYAEAFADAARERGWACALPHFRGCSGEINRAPRAYHSGDHEEIGWMLARLRSAHRGPRMAAGFSLGGNALLRWAADAGEQACRSVDAVAAVCSLWIWRQGAGRSAAVSTGRYTHACSCGRSFQKPCRNTCTASGPVCPGHAVEGP